MKNYSLNDIEDNKKEKDNQLKDNIKINDFKQESKMPRDLSLDNTIIEQRGFNSEKAKEKESIDKLRCRNGNLEISISALMERETAEL